MHHDTAAPSLLAACLAEGSDTSRTEATVAAGLQAAGPLATLGYIPIKWPEAYGE